LRNCRKTLLSMTGNSSGSLQRAVDGLVLGIDTAAKLTEGDEDGKRYASGDDRVFNRSCSRSIFMELEKKTLQRTAPSSAPWP
jgi:hypothetical protein